MNEYSLVHIKLAKIMENDNLVIYVPKLEQISNQRPEI